MPHVTHENHAGTKKKYKIQQGKLKVNTAHTK